MVEYSNRQLGIFAGAASVGTLPISFEAGIGFLIGFLVNLVMMRSMFVSNKSCEACEIRSEKQLMEIKGDVAKVETCILGLHGEVKTLAALIRVHHDG